MMMSAFVFRFWRSFAPRFPHMAMVAIAEYDRAMLAASHYEDLRGRRLAERDLSSAGPGGIARAVFEAFYSKSTSMSTPEESCVRDVQF